jgi:hypothetical protein
MYDPTTVNFGRRRIGGAAALAAAAAATLGALGLIGAAGCGSDSGTEPVPQPSPSATPLRLTGTFFGPEVPPSTGPAGQFTLGRSYVRLSDGVPQAVGFELTRAGREGQPPTAITDEGPNVYFVALPPEAAATCFKQMGVFYFTGHPVDQYRPVGEPEHFHAVFLVNAPQQPSEGFATELKYPDPAEIPAGVPRGVPDTVVPGVGVSYDDGTKPVGQPARVTIEQNFLFYDGHLNGYVVGQNLSFLRDGALQTDVIPQPAIYPRPGYYPRRWTIRYDAARDVNVFEVSDFVLIGPEKSRKRDAAAAD